LIHANLKLDLLLLERMASDAELGWYSLAASAAQLLWRVPAAVGIVLWSENAGVALDRAGALRVLRLVRVTTSLLVAAALVLAAAAGVLVPFVYGEAFTPSVLLIRLLLPGIVAMGAFNLLHYDLTARGLTRPSSYALACMVAGDVALNVLLIPRYGAVGAAIAASFVYGVGGLVMLLFYCKLSGVGAWEALRPRRGDFAWSSRWPTQPGGGKKQS
jgi:O-antigen/teichoic acid export membrane protein